MPPIASSRARESPATPRYARSAAPPRIDSWTLTGRGEEFGEFGQIGIHKGAAVERLAARLGVLLAELIGFGDARSALELLTTCGTGVARGNAPEDVKAVADLVTDHGDRDGLAQAFRRLGLTSRYPPSIDQPT